MQGIEYLLELYEALPRCGPGEDASTRRAFTEIPNPPAQPFILDIGCGSGAPTIALAKVSNGRIIALDRHQGFLDKLMENAKEEGVADNITPKNMSMHEMDFDEGTFDIIWSEGALYFMGFQSGLKRCHRFLRDDGHLAVTELVYLVPDPPTPVVQYFEEEYPDIATVAEKISLLRDEGFRLVSNFTLPKSAWLDNYYSPMEEELARLGRKYQGNAIASLVIQGMQGEADHYKRFSDSYGYEFFIVQKIK